MKQSNSKLLLITLFVFTNSFSLKAVCAADPNLNKEKMFHQIYKKYSSKPTDSKLWSDALMNKTDKKYVIQKGDTLWSLSETLFGDPKFWTKIWSINVSPVENPNYISINKELYFVPGTLDEAPSVNVAQVEKMDEESAPKEETPKLTEQELNWLSSIKLPPSEKNRAAYSEPPESLPALPLSIKTDQQIDFTSLKGKLSPDSFEQSFLTSYIVDEKPESVGVVVGGDEGRSAFSDVQELYVKINDLGENKKFLVVKYETFKDRKTNRKILISVIKGEIAVIEAVNKEDNVYRAKVLYSFEPIENKDQIIVGDLIEKKSIPQIPSTEPLNCRIVGGYSHGVRFFYGIDTIVFLDVGSEDSIQVGQIVPIYRNEPLRNGPKVVTENSKHIANLKILKASSNYSSAEVLNADGDLLQDDRCSPAIGN